MKMLNIDQNVVVENVSLSASDLGGAEIAPGDYLRITIQDEGRGCRRLTRTPSTSSPAGIWQTAAATPLAAMMRPMLPEPQCWVPFR
jgi:hypothetical protein